MSIQLNQGQKTVVEEAVKWFKSGTEQVFQYSGGAGTGKTTVLNAILDALEVDRMRVAPMSYVGAAAINMRIHGLYNARTIHSWLYKPVETTMLDNNGKPMQDNYFDRPVLGLEFEPKPLDGIDLMVIDEGGTVPKSMKREIESRGIPIIVLGDVQQLKPVADDPAYLYEGKIHYLTEIMRQGLNSSIPILADKLIKGETIHKGYYGDVWVIDHDELTDEMIMASQILVCGKNSTREELNKRIRHDILKINSDLPIYGEKVICRKNNWKKEIDGISLANGLVGTVENNPDVGSFDGKSFTIDFRPDKMRMKFPNLKCDYKYFVANPEARKFIKNNKYSTSEKFEFAYAITTHVSQGATYNNGIYIEEYLSQDINRNLNYTGLTRFSNHAIYVKQKRKFY